VPDPLAQTKAYDAMNLRCAREYAQLDPKESPFLLDFARRTFKRHGLFAELEAVERKILTARPVVPHTTQEGTD
jgi:hypothetical protein